MSQPKSELYVITSMKNLVEYVLTISEKSPKKFRYSLLDRMHKACFEGIELLYEANSCPLSSVERRQKQTMFRVKLKVIDYLGGVGEGRGCFTFHQYETICKYIHDCDRLLRAWVTSDQRRAEEGSNKEKAI